VYRIISLGLTGFDVPLSDHAIPEARSVLISVLTIASFYKQTIPAALYSRQQPLFKKAIAYLDRNQDFKTFDRITFIRDYLNPISEWLSECTHKLGYINYTQRSPLNPDAKTLFSCSIFDLRFFSPNDKYRLTHERISQSRSTLVLRPHTVGQWYT
jgi:cytochrome c peroxidase